MTYLVACARLENCLAYLAVMMISYCLIDASRLLWHVALFRKEAVTYPLSLHWSLLPLPRRCSGWQLATVLTRAKGSECGSKQYSMRPITATRQMVAMTTIIEAQLIVLWGSGSFSFSGSPFVVVGVVVVVGYSLV